MNSGARTWLVFPVHRSIPVLEYVIWFLQWHGRGRLLYSARVLSQKEWGRVALNLRGYYLSISHIAHKAHSQKSTCCERSWDNASFRDGSEVSFISNRTERWSLEFQLTRRRSHSPIFLYFRFIRSVITIWLLFNRYCIKLRLTDFMFYSHASEVLALDIIFCLKIF